jgi:hypothetical protein
MAAGGVDPANVDFAELADLTGRRPERRTYDYLHTTFAISTGVYRALSSDATVEGLVRLAQQWQPDLVVWDTMTFAGAVAATVAGPRTRLLFGLDLLGHARQTYQAHLDGRPDRVRDDPFRAWLGAVLRRYGAEFDERVVVGQWTVDPVPGSIGLLTDQLRVPVRYIPYNGPATVPSWLTEPPRRTRVCLTLGQTGRDVLGGYRASIAQLLAALADLDVEVVATLDRSQVGDLARLPTNVRAWTSCRSTRCCPNVAVEARCELIEGGCAHRIEGVGDIDPVDRWPSAICRAMAVRTRPFPLWS